jgi:hypothetical protein
MRPPFISSIVFRNYLNLLCKLIDLPTSLQLVFPGTAVKEYTVFHRMTLKDYGSKDGLFVPTLEVKSYAVHELSSLTTDEEYKLMLIDPEIAFSEDGVFWSGAPMKIFKDYSAMLDKKYGKLSWCASYERDLAYPQFVINENEPLFSSQYVLSALEMLSTPEEKRVFVGTVEEDGTVVPPAATKLTNTINDSVLDGAPKDAVPSFLKTT